MSKTVSNWLATKKISVLFDPLTLLLEVFYLLAAERNKLFFLTKSINFLSTTNNDSLYQVKPEMPMSTKFDLLMTYFNKMAGGDKNSIGFNNSVFLSERDTADRNFALAYFMKENKCFPQGFNLQETLDFYFQVTT